MCVEGLGLGTRRDLDRPRGWLGISRQDSVLLDRLVRGLGAGLVELHTDVRVGLRPVVPSEARTDWMERLGAALYPLRIDACILAGGHWWVVEIKPDAGYVSLGQVLTYEYFARRTCECLRECTPAVLTDHVQECLRPLFSRYGVKVFEVGYAD